jgi:hypothetical protein
MWLESKQEANRASRQRLPAYFFYQSAQPELENAVIVIRRFVYLLIAQKEESMRHVQQQYELVGKDMFEGLNAVHVLRDTLADMLYDVSMPLGHSISTVGFVDVLTVSILVTA